MKYFLNLLMFGKSFADEMRFLDNQSFLISSGRVDEAVTLGQERLNRKRKTRV